MRRTPGSTASTHNLVASVWVGFDQERSLGEGEEGAQDGAADLDALHARGAARRAADSRAPMPDGIVDAAHLTRDTGG